MCFCFKKKAHFSAFLYGIQILWGDEKQLLKQNKIFLMIQIFNSWTAIDQINH